MSIKNVSRRAEFFQRDFSPLAEGEARTAGYFSDGKVSAAAMRDRKCVRSSTLVHSKVVGMMGCCEPKLLLKLLFCLSCLTLSAWKCRLSASLCSLPHSQAHLWATLNESFPLPCTQSPVWGWMEAEQVCSQQGL